MKYCFLFLFYAYFFLDFLHIFLREIKYKRQNFELFTLNYLIRKGVSYAVTELNNFTGEANKISFVTSNG